MIQIAKKYGGIPAGSDNGIKGYQLTFMIAYIRDFCFPYNIIGDSFETSCKWDDVQRLCDNTRYAIYKLNAEWGMKPEDAFVSFRIT